MIKTYLLVALRRLSREKLYVSINILSLALGIASFLILALYLRSELTYDQHNVNHRQIYRLATRFDKQGDRVSNFALSQVGIGPLLTQDFPQVGKYVRFQNAAPQRGVPVILKHNDIQREWDNVFLADSTVFEVFTHKILYGDPKTAFDSPYSIAISERVAKSFFGDDNPIGKKFSTGQFAYAVTLVFADQPENTHLKYDALLPFSLMEVFNPNIAKNYENTLWSVGIYTNGTSLSLP